MLYNSLLHFKNVLKVHTRSLFWSCWRTLKNLLRTFQDFFKFLKEHKYLLSSWNVHQSLQKMVAKYC